MLPITSFTEHEIPGRFASPKPTNKGYGLQLYLSSWSPATSTQENVPIFLHPYDFEDRASKSVLPTLHGFLPH